VLVTSPDKGIDPALLRRRVTEDVEPFNGTLTAGK